MSAAEHHRAVAADFTARVLGTTDWDVPAPVEGWTARDVVDHLVTWLPELLISRNLPHAGLGDLDKLDHRVALDHRDPVAAWQAHVAGVQALLDGPDADVDVVDPHLGGQTVGQMIDRIYTADVFMHTWDLARATGQDDTLDAEACAEMVAGMEGIEEMLRASGQFGQRVAVPTDADAQTRLIAFIGRNPWWPDAPPTRS